MLDLVTAFQKNGSGWRIEIFYRIHLAVSDYNLLFSSSYILLSKFLANMTLFVNMKNYDKLCFVRCILQFLKDDLHSSRVD